MPRGPLLPLFAALALAAVSAGASDRLGDSPPLRLLPPVEARGALRVDTLATDPAIDRVVFYLDEAEVGADGSRPFSMRLDVPRGEGPHTLRGLALDGKGRPLGDHSVTLARESRAFDVAIRRVEGSAEAGWVDVEVEAAVPPGETLERIELYRNRERVAVSAESPLRARVSTPAPDPADYLRAVAVLAGGRSMEDARLVSSPDPGERLDVHLVELVAVASDRAGDPVRGLGADDFEVVLDGHPLPIERFREAREVPLTLGVLVDTSTSMRPIMEETREAAQHFLEQTIGPGDRALLVDIGTQPRLAHGLTGDPAALGAAFEGLEAEGDTALYDSLALATVELLRLPGRRALVVLSDGEDSSSYLGLGRCLELARSAGIPVYVVSLGGLDPRKTHPDRNFRLAAFARETGGRLYAVTSSGEVDRAYRQIEAELRSQYVLGVTSNRVLAADEIAGLEVRPREGRWKVRVARRGADGGP